MSQNKVVDVLEHSKTGTLRWMECATRWADSRRKYRGAMQGSGEAAPSCTTAVFQQQRRFEDDVQRTMKRDAVNQLTRRSPGVSMLSNPCTGKRPHPPRAAVECTGRVADLGAYAWYEWCGKLMVIRTITGLAHANHVCSRRVRHEGSL